MNMATRGKGPGMLLVMLILGLLIGGAVGELIGLLCPEGVVKQFFIRAVTPGLGPTVLDLHAFTITLGVSINVNVMSVLGILLAVYIYRWY